MSLLGYSVIRTDLGRVVSGHHGFGECLNDPNHYMVWKTRERAEDFMQRMMKSTGVAAEKYAIVEIRCVILTDAEEI